MAAFRIQSDMAQNCVGSPNFFLFAVARLRKLAEKPLELSDTWT